MATLQDIARLTGVSVSTVSRVLNGQTGLSISDDIKERIFEAAEQLNYRVKTRRRSIGRQKIRQVAVIGWFNEERDLRIPYYSLIRHGIELECRNLGMDGSSLHFEWSDSIRTYSYFMDYDGIIVIGPNQDAIEYFLDKDKRVVFIDCSPNPHRYYAVLPDLAHGTRQAVEHLIRLGYTSIGYLGGANEAEFALPRYRTFRQCLEERGLYRSEFVILEGDWTVSTGYAMAQRCLKEGRVAQAYLIGNDPMAIGAFNAFLDAGLRIPEDVAIVGFDDILEMVAYVRPPLTTVRTPAMMVGRLAANLLLNGLCDDSPPFTITVPTQLVIRESCGYTLKNGHNIQRE
ncbi:putative HTH-type transcriptional regulator MsmR [Alicyclobacillus cellulosilyticus]|uniref:HTH-type transcriptional regulator MsmR n=2 Tax=Alicyclobacillus cellulosilyticus TaxID=1003997 RepID=A0A917KGZ2_9BACL|nr:putative HTH-type transcriptional regulator MsmR [Alicyclobacillus cellulosilyticus]